MPSSFLQHRDFSLESGILRFYKPPHNLGRESGFL